MNMAKQGLVSTVLEKLSKLYDTFTGYERKNRKLTHRIAEQGMRLGNKVDHLTEENSRLVAALASEKRQIELGQGTVSRAEKALEKIAVDRIGHERTKKHLAAKEKELRVYKFRKAREMGEAVRATHQKTVDSYRLCPNSKEAVVILDHWGIIRYQSHLAQSLLGKELLGKSVRKAIGGSPKEKRETSMHFTSYGEGYVYLSGGRDGEIPAHVRINPETMYHGADGTPNEIRHSTVVTIRKAPFHSIYSKVRRGAKVFYQQRLRKNIIPPNETQGHTRKGIDAETNSN